jgi:cytidylate kinase
VKIYVTATPEERARRRATELKTAGDPADEAAILADILRRDERDRSRAVAPLKAAPDAHMLDTTHLGVDAVVQAAIAIIENKLGRKPVT